MSNKIITLDDTQVRNLQIAATKMRMDVVDCVHAAKSGHPGGSLSACEVLAYLYFYRMNLDPANPNLPTRDRLVLSKGHATPAYYAALARRGFFDVAELANFRKVGHILQGHPDKKHIPGVDMSSGSLGQGLSAACGMAIAGKKSGASYNVFAILGDGELQEGQNWEAAMFASHYQLDNLCAIVDYNNLQITDSVDKVMNVSSIAGKFEAFGWNAIEVDGTNFRQIDDAVNAFCATNGKPTVIIAKTVKGKGVSFMENSTKWHGSAPNDEQHAAAIAELQKVLAALEG